MTVAGMNRRATIWRYSYTDDNVGGAVSSGTALYTNVPLRMQEQPEQQLLLQQGLETQKTFTGIVIPGTLKIRERDELEVTEPFDDVYHGDRFRIVNVRWSDLNPRDPRNYINLTMVRSVIAHNRQ